MPEVTPAAADVTPGPRLSQLLTVEAIHLGATAQDWRAAVRLAGDALVTSGATAPAYTDEMIATVEQLGPYIVIAPGIALAHSRPSPAVHPRWYQPGDPGRPVDFGHRTNDPVRLVVGLAAPDEEGHVTALSTLAEFLSDEQSRVGPARGSPARRSAFDWLAPSNGVRRSIRPAAGRGIEGLGGTDVKILAVCGMGLGTSLILRMNAEKALKQLGIEADVEVSDMGSARALAATADLVLTSEELAEQLGPVKPKVITISNFIDLNEMVTKLKAAIG